MATRTISTRVTLDGEKEFKQQMGLVNSELKTLASEMTLATAEFKGQANSAEYLTRKDEILRREIEQQTEKVEGMTEQLEKYKKQQTEVAEELKTVSKRLKDSGLSAEQLADGFENALSKAKGLTGAQEKLLKRGASLEQAQDALSTAINKTGRDSNYVKAKLADLNNDLKDNSRYLDEARESADGCAKSIDEYGKAVKDAGNQNGGKGLNLGSLVSDLGKLKGMLAGGAVVAGLKEVSSAIIGIVDDTEEYRKIMGTLEVSSQAAGYSAEQTAEAYGYLQGVLGDTQAAATTVANLQAIGLSQADLMTMVEAATGAWATYGDSIPIDGLSESINETIQAGKVTGTFADVLNWAGVSEDDFNAKLDAANSSTERAQIVLDQLSRQGLPETARQWRAANEDIVAYNESQEKLDAAMGELGEVLAPVAAGLKNIFAEGVLIAADAVAWLIEKITAAIDWLEKFNEKVDEGEERAYNSPNSRKAGYDRLREKNGTDGKFKTGLKRVPYDGFIAELHEDERVLTAREAQVYNALERYGAPAVGGVTANELRSTVAQAVNAMNGSERPVYVTVVSTMKVNGREFFSETLPDLRAVESASPALGGDA